MTGRRRLLLVSPRFLFPVDSGGKIRTTQILKGMKGGAFEITLVSPAPPDAERFRAELDEVCDRFHGWPESGWRRFPALERLRHAFSALPIPVAADRSAAGRALVERCLAEGADLAMFDFPHATVLGWDGCETARAIFTHNVETEIFERHVATSGRLRALVWRNQRAKMAAFEARVLAEADGVVAVSSRDARAFEERFGVRDAAVINTGVDLGFFRYREPAGEPRIVFTGAMDWLANVDGIRWFMDEVWPRVARAHPAARVDVVGRAPPQSLVSRAASRGLPWRFTGFVDDVRDYVAGGSVFVIPLRVAGGTRLKVFEAMAMGCPVVSTSIGIEGLDVRDGEHYLEADGPVAFAARVIDLLEDREQRLRIARTARDFVERSCSYLAVAQQFESICTEVVERAARSRAGDS